MQTFEGRMEKYERKIFSIQSIAKCKQHHDNACLSSRLLTNNIEKIVNLIIDNYYNERSIDLNLKKND